MINADEDTLICDFAETYHVFDYKALPLRLAAILAAGLSDCSRIKVKLSGAKTDIKTMLLAAAADGARMAAWLNSSDGATGANRPMSLLEAIVNPQDSEEGFDSGNDFEAWKRKIQGKEV